MNAKLSAQNLKANIANAELAAKGREEECKRIASELEKLGAFCKEVIEKATGDKVEIIVEGRGYGEHSISIVIRIDNTAVFPLLHYDVCLNGFPKARVFILGWLGGSDLAGLLYIHKNLKRNTEKDSTR